MTLNLAEPAFLGGLRLADPYWSNVSLLLQPIAGGAIVDLSPSPKTLTVSGNTQVSSSPGYPAILFDSAGDYITIGNNNAFDTNQAFTFEMFFNRTSGNAMFFCRSGGAENWNATNGHAILIYIEGLTLYVQVFASASSLITQSVAAPSTGALHYLSVCYDGTTLQGHLNTARFGNASASLAVPTIRNIIEVGSYFGARGSYDLNGNIRAMRWTTGVGRNSGATITVPSLPFPTS